MRPEPRFSEVAPIPVFKPDSASGIPAQNFTGGSGWIAVNVAPALGVVADFGGCRTASLAGLGVHAFSCLLARGFRCGAGKLVAVITNAGSAK